MRTAEWALATILCATPLGANECRAPKNAVKTAVICGNVRDPAGELVADVELQLVNKDQGVAAEVHTDGKGDFNFGSVREGVYNLATKSKGWKLWWPVKVTSSRPMEVCKQPLLVELSVGGCGGSVRKKGYHAKW